MLAAKEKSSMNMQKWGIPEDDMVSAEVTLLERLVWVPYNEHWWPALLYDNYTELQDQLYKELDVVSKAQFATAIMRQLNNPKPIKIARLLGREVLEVVEVLDTEYAEFYWQLPKVLPMACKKSNYGNDTKRYLDFHRALDQVEEIIRDISQDSFNLLPNAEKKTWLQRAQEALAYPDMKSSIDASAEVAKLIKMKEAADEQEYHFLFSALDGMMEKCNNTYDCACASGNVEDKIVEEEQATHSMSLTKQRETRASLRRALERQRQLREAGSIACFADDDDEREGVSRSPSTEVLPAASGDESFFWNMLNPREEPTMARTSTKKVYVQPRSPLSSPSHVPIDSREEFTEGDRRAIIAAARAAAAAELHTSFWDALTCNSTTNV